MPFQTISGAALNPPRLWTVDTCGRQAPTGCLWPADRFQRAPPAAGPVREAAAEPPASRQTETCCLCMASLYGSAGSTGPPWPHPPTPPPSWQTGIRRISLKKVPARGRGGGRQWCNPAGKLNPTAIPTRLPERHRLPFPSEPSRPVRPIPHLSRRCAPGVCRLCDRPCCLSKRSTCAHHAPAPCRLATATAKRRSPTSGCGESYTSRRSHIATGFQGKELAESRLRCL